MSNNEEFDELARRKLDEQAFPFRETDWDAARALIDAQRRRRRWGAWITGATVLLLISGLTWYGTRSAGTENTVAFIEEVAPSTVGANAIDQPVENHSATPMAAPMAAPLKANKPTSALDVRTAPIKSIPAHAADRTPEQPTAVAASTEGSAPQKEEVKHTSGAASPTLISSKRKMADNKQTAVATEEPKAAIIPTQRSAHHSEAAIATTSATDPAINGNPVGPVDPKAGTTAQQDQANTNAPSSSSTDQPGSQDQQTLAMPADQGSKQASGAGKQHDELHSGTVDSINAEDPRSSTSMDFAVQPNAGVLPSATDTTATNTASTSLPGDSANLAAAVAPTPPPLVPDRAPWEISLLGGAFSSTSTYSGSNSADWSGNISAERSIGIGAEIMRMGRNIGIGTGLHFGSYADRIRMDAVDVSSSALHNYWYLMAVDTTVLVITDTLPGIPPSYTGTSMDTTLHILAQGTDTVISQQHLRDARDQVNRVSYLEVPLLLDAHVTQGRWMLGLRGGPTIGLLTGRRGSLPNNTDNGYLGFTDVAFREVVFGYTARAYVRYRFNAGWSVGVEPALRGQVLNSLGSGGLERRSNAKGVMLSLTYRLR